MKIIHVLRKPCLKGYSVAENTLQFGTGGLNIDACRVGIDSTIRPVSTTIGYNGKATGLDYIVCGSQAGRWPANLILQHLQDCQRTGTKKIPAIKGTNAGIRSGKDTAVYHKFNGYSDLEREAIGYGDAEGNETIEAWECQENCPAKQLDIQTGNRPGMPLGTGPKIYGGGGGLICLNRQPHLGFGDSGGASRFFKQVR